MSNYALPVNDKDISKAKTFYDLICWGGLLIVLLPVGIANVILGYFMGDSPCTLCWGQRQEMAYIGVVALFMVRYGFKPKYLATMLVMAAVGLYMSFRHYGNHAMRDVGRLRPRRLRHPHPVLGRNRLLVRRLPLRSRRLSRPAL